MSDNKTVSNMPDSTAAAVLDKNQLVPFTYPEGFNAVANSLQFLPEEARVQALVGLMLTVIING
jgi:hypothetical protein